MDIDIKKGFFTACIISLFFFSYLYFFAVMNSKYFKDFKKYNFTISELNISQGTDNHSIECKLNKLAWIEVQLILKITSNQSGQVSCEFMDFKGGKYFKSVGKSINLNGNNETQTVRLFSRPSILTFPGKYNFSLNISGLFSYNKDFEIIFGMGYITLILFSSILGIGLILILIKKSESKGIKTATPTPKEYSLAEIAEIVNNKITCPECKKVINEGLAFCPECGSRIPEFMRFNPNSARGL
ncbi:MAG: hypothetical protein ACFFB0_07320 [Promethearchaeota archaeon]